MMQNIHKLLLAALMLAWLTSSANAQISGTVILPGVTPVIGTCTNGYNLYNNNGVVGCQANTGGGGGVTSVSFTGGIISVATPTTTPALTVAGTSGGIPYFSSTSTWASSALLAANALMIGGGAGTAPSTTTTGTGVLTALGVNVGSAGAFVVNGGALGTPSSGVATNITGLVYTALPALSANQVLGALTATTPSGLSVPSCSAASSALTWTSGTGFGCNTITSGALTVGSTGTSGGATGQVMYDTGSVLTESANLKFTTGLIINAGTLVTNEAFVLDYSPGANTLTSGLGVINANVASTGNQQPSCLRLSGQGWKTTATAASQEVAEEICVSPVQGAANPTGGLEFLHEINGSAFSKIADYGVTAVSQWTFQGNVNFAANVAAITGNMTIASTGAYIFSTRGQITSSAAGDIQLGAADAAAPVAQTLSAQSVVAGTSNTNGVNWTHTGSTSTGTGTAGDIIFQTGGTGAAATVQNTQVTALTIKGATQLVQLNAITSDATHTDATICEDTTTHALYSGSGTLGICLGTSSVRFKHDVTDLDAGLPEIMAIQPRRYFLNSDHGDAGKPYYGFLAEDGAVALPELVGYDDGGQPNTFDYLGIVPVLVRAVQQQQAEIDAIRLAR